MTSRMFQWSFAADSNERSTPRRFVMASWAFLAATVVISSSALLDSGELNTGDFIWSLVMLALAASTLVLSVRRHARALALVVPVLGTAWALLLVLATGGSSSGLALALLLPIIWSAINLAPWESLIVFAVLAVSELVITVSPVPLSDALRVRRIGIYLLVSALTAYSIHALRLRLARLDADRSVANALLRETVAALESRNREERALRRLTDQLHACRTRESGFDLIARAAPDLFRSAGAVAVVESASGVLETVAAWIVAPDDGPVSIPASCTMFRDAREHEWRGDDHCDRLCAGTGVTACQPLLREREVVGILTLRVPEGTTSAAGWSPEDEFRHLVSICAEQISTWITTFELRESLRELSVRDPLTQLFNRRYFEATLDRELGVARRMGSPLALAMIDVDHFKDFNDRFGHATGDHVLESVAVLLDEAFRGSDVVARTGGEEFTVVLPNCTGAVALARAERLRQQLRDAVITADGSGVVEPPTVSIGIAASPPFDASRDELLRAADHALYRSKHAGRDQTSVARVLD